MEKTVEEITRGPSSDGAAPFQQEISSPDMINAFQAQQQAVPERTYFELAKDTYELADTTTAKTLLERKLERNRLEAKNEDKIDPIELNSMFPGMEVPFGKPTSLSVAQYVADYQYERQLRKVRISQGPQGYSAFGLSFGAGMLAHATDPIELAAGLIMGKGINMMAKAWKVTRPLTGYAAGTWQRFAVATGENIAGEALIEPFLAQGMKQEQLEYTSYDAMQSIIGGGLGGSFLELGLGKMGNFYRNYKAKGADLTTKKSMSDMLDGRIPEVDKVADFMTAKKNAELLEVPAEKYEYRKIDSPEAANKTYYSSKHRSVVDSPNSLSPHKDFYVGEGMYLSDSPRWAEGYVYQGEGFTNKSEVVSYNPTKKISLMDLDAPMDAEFATAFREAAIKSKPEGFHIIGKDKADADAAFPVIVDDIINLSRTKKDAFEQLKNLAETNNINKEVFDELIESLGNRFDGYVFNGKNVDGDITNDVFLFDGRNSMGASEIKKQKYKSNTNEVSGVSREMMEAPEPEAKMFYDKDEDIAFREAPESLDSILPGDEAYLAQKSDVQKLIEDLDDPEVSDLASMEWNKIAEEVKKDMKDLEGDDLLMKASLFCVKGE